MDTKRTRHTYLLLFQSNVAFRSFKKPAMAFVGTHEDDIHTTAVKAQLNSIVKI